ncbi:MAG TPA: hypothetical protein VLJ17_02065 [Xanthobacteraceae bacterium]|nr:hypothetical protein [Xanthobacteraceae bacterium]
MKRTILFLAGFGIVFLASAVQTFGKNWLGQVCPYPGRALTRNGSLSAACYQPPPTLLGR